YFAKISDTLRVKPNGLSYLWDNNSTEKYRPVNDSGIYHVLFTDSLGCSTLDSIQLQINPLPEFSLGPDTFYCNNFTRVLSAFPGAKEYVWNTSDTTETISVSDKGLFWAEVVDTNTCVYRDSIQILNPKTNIGFTIETQDSCLN